MTFKFFNFILPKINILEVVRNWIFIYLFRIKRDPVIGLFWLKKGFFFYYLFL